MKGNINYNKVLENIITQLKEKPRLLLHSCCGPCSSYVITYLKDFFDITVLYYNPNIEPEEEYIKRKKEQIRLINELKSDIHILDIPYLHDEYVNKVSNLREYKEGSVRCHVCYAIRLEKTAKVAKENNFDYFGTTLTVSPYKNAKLINKLGENLAKKYDIKWLYSDFKKKDGYKKSIELSKKYNLYRQDYCGCLSSKGDSDE